MTDNEQDDTAPATAPARPGRVYAPQRRGFMRATRDEGIGAELAAMDAEARGTPLFGAAAAADAAPDAKDATISRLLHALRRQRGAPPAQHQDRRPVPAGSGESVRRPRR